MAQQVDTALSSRVDMYMAKPYRIEMQRDGGGWYVRVPDFPGCMSQGDTQDEALQMIDEAMHLWIQITLEDGYSIPEPSQLEADDQKSDTSASGKFVVRLPRAIHKQLADAAKSEGVSLNLFAATALARAVGAHRNAEAASRPYPTADTARPRGVRSAKEE